MFGLVLKKINLKLHFYKLIVLSLFCNPSNSLDYQEIPYLIKFCNFKSINSRCGRAWNKQMWWYWIILTSDLLHIP
jgi:hypothetical protein